MVNIHEKSELVLELSKCPEKIEQAEIEVLKCIQELILQKETLAMMEAELIMTEQIDGNKGQRKAQLLRLTGLERKNMNEAEDNLTKKQINLRKSVNEFSALKSVAMIVGGGDAA